MEILRICKTTFSNAIKELLEKGFIDITRPGIGKYRVSTLYAISNRWRKYGTPEFVKVEVKRSVNEEGRQALIKYHADRRKIKKKKENRKYRKPYLSSTKI